MRSLTTLLALLALAAPALAQDPAPLLKPVVTVTSDIVHIGDLIENAGPNAHVAVFRAPDLGNIGLVATSRILDAVRAHQVTDVETNGVTEVAVTRLSRSFGVKEIETHIIQAATSRYGVGQKNTLSVGFDRDVRTMHFDASAGDLQLVRFSYDARSTRFDAAFDLPDAAARRRAPLRFSGTIVETVETAVLAQPLNRGDVIKSSDVTVERRPKSELVGDMVAKAEQVVGMALRRPVRAGQPLRQADLMKPELVTRNELVTIFYEVPGIKLTLRGKALESGAEGDVVTVQNLLSKRNIQGVVSGQGAVTATGTARPSTHAASSVGDEPRRRTE
jgi:flagella basal body P-ring formation protein FlgA